MPLRRPRERQGFVPNGPATALSANRSNIVALVHAGKLGRRQPSPHDSVFVDEVERRLSAAGRYLMIRSADDVALTAAELRSWRIDGAVILGTFTSDADEVQAKLAMPLVFVDNYPAGPGRRRCCPGDGVPRRRPRRARIGRTARLTGAADDPGPARPSQGTSWILISSAGAPRTTRRGQR
ncbi:MAG TPA: hypothetical protein VGK18_12350 [Propionicimonas sp.]|uniref:hypothetical protein n=1 Tax=Propionicimonas sp. TaxID=1955623 RepID=UPI002F3FCB46